MSVCEWKTKNRIKDPRLVIEDWEYLYLNMCTNLLSKVTV